jgi:D-arabinose 1-dehydrogenase-like Zn-dependent alcohol dehydrogenase
MKPKEWEQTNSMPRRLIKSLKELRGYFDLIVNTLSVEIDWNRYLGLLALDGTMVVVGIPEKETTLGAAPLSMLAEVSQVLL